MKSRSQHDVVAEAAFPAKGANAAIHTQLFLPNFLRRQYFVYLTTSSSSASRLG